MQITKLKTGIGLAGSPIALIIAPKDAKPGSLEPVTRFLQERGIRTLPGYHGPQKLHVLRLNGFGGDEKLLRLLKDEFPAWQKQHPENTGIDIAVELACEPIDEVDHFPFQSPLRKFVRENSNVLAGLAYEAGNIGMLMSAMRRQPRLPHPENPDVLKMLGSFSYMAATTSLLALGFRADNPRDVFTLTKEAMPEVAKQMNGQHKAESGFAHMLRFFRHHPWEIAGLLNMAGASAHIASTLRRGAHESRKIEALSALGTLVACTMMTLVPEKGGRALFDMGKILPWPDVESFHDSMQQFKEHHRMLAPLAEGAEQVGEWIRESPLRAAAPIQAVANAGYGIAGLTRKGHKDYGLLGMSGLYLTGNAIQAVATKGRGPSFDSVCNAAADAILSQESGSPEMQSQRAERIRLLAEQLARQPEIVQPTEKLQAGIAERLKREQAGGGSVLDGFLPSEKPILKQSPFISPHLVERWVRPAASDAAGMTSSY